MALVEAGQHQTKESNLQSTAGTGQQCNEHGMLRLVNRGVNIRFTQLFYNRWTD